MCGGDAAVASRLQRCNHGSSRSCLKASHSGGIEGQPIRFCNVIEPDLLRRLGELVDWFVALVAPLAVLVVASGAIAIERCTRDLVLARDVGDGEELHLVAVDKDVSFLVGFGWCTFLLVTSGCLGCRARPVLR